MANIFNDDFRDFLAALNRHSVDYLLVGGYSVILHGYSRTTGDMDIWVRKSAENYARLQRAFADFGMPMFDMTRQNFLDNPEMDVFTFGRQPSAIDLMTSVKGVDFDEAFAIAPFFDAEGLPVRVIHLSHLLQAKRASARPRDLDDLEHLDEESIAAPPREARPHQLARPCKTPS